MIDENFIFNLSYPDFVAFIGQNNTPPGGQKTIDNWINFGFIKKGDYVLDLACSTGFSSRNIVKNIDCTAIGIDISQTAIQEAQEISKKLNLQGSLQYMVEDACKQHFLDETFSHILGGCNFAFIQKRNDALRESFRVLKKNGKLYISNFYYTSELPEKILSEIYSTINFMPNKNWTKRWWEEFFSPYFNLVKSIDYSLTVFSDEKIKNATYDFIFNHSSSLKNAEENIKLLCAERLYKDRSILNQHRQYQMYNNQVWEKNE